MKKEFILVFFVLILSLSLASASWFSDFVFTGKITFEKIRLSFHGRNPSYGIGILTAATTTTQIDSTNTPDGCYIIEDEATKRVTCYQTKNGKETVHRSYCTVEGQGGGIGGGKYKWYDCPDPSGDCVLQEETNCSEGEKCIQEDEGIKCQVIQKDCYDSDFDGVLDFLPFTHGECSEKAMPDSEWESKGNDNCLNNNDLQEYVCDQYENCKTTEFVCGNNKCDRANGVCFLQTPPDCKAENVGKIKEQNTCTPGANGNTASVICSADKSRIKQVKCNANKLDCENVQNFQSCPRFYKCNETQKKCVWAGICPRGYTEMSQKFIMTAYCDCDCTKGATCTGPRANNEKIIAVDPTVIRLGSSIIVFDSDSNEVLRGRAEDTGGEIIGAKLDIWVDGYSAAMAQGAEYYGNEYTVCVKRGTRLPIDCRAGYNPHCKETTCAGALGHGERGLCRA